jgi:hypothetical protein
MRPRTSSIDQRKDRHPTGERGIDGTIKGRAAECKCELHSYRLRIHFAGNLNVLQKDAPNPLARMALPGFVAADHGSDPRAGLARKPVLVPDEADIGAESQQRHKKQNQHRSIQHHQNCLPDSYVL